MARCVSLMIALSHGSVGRKLLDVDPFRTEMLNFILE